MTTVKNGAMHLASLRDGRQIYLDGGLIDDHTEHPAFHNAVRSAAHLYDFQASSEQLEHMTFASPRTGVRVSRMWQLPTSLAELVERRKALVSWAELSCGMLGRSPDHVASALSGLYMGLDQFEAYDRRCAAAVREYYEYARDADLYLTYAIVSPQADRSKGASEQADEFLPCGICDEDSTGITLRGAKMLATATPLANALMVGSIQPLRPGEETPSCQSAIPAMMQIATPAQNLNHGVGGWLASVPQHLSDVSSSIRKAIGWSYQLL